MKNGICPKCGASEVYAGTEVFPKSGPFTSNAIPIGLATMAPLDNYVCMACGYVESYIGNRDDLAAVRRKWPRIVTEEEKTPPADDV
jgi:predicted nucleic-acid-binding Zn-ribbon protein